MLWHWDWPTLLTSPLHASGFFIKHRDLLLLPLVSLGGYIEREPIVNGVLLCSTKTLVMRQRPIQMAGRICIRRYISPPPTLPCF